MRFYVPQFIDVEDKIFGPLSFKQFAYLVGGAGAAYLFYALFPIYIAIVPMLAVIGLAIALAFYQVNNKPFIHILQSALRYFTGKKLYVWKKEYKAPTPQEPAEEIRKEAQGYIPRLSDSKLKEISWSLGVKDSIYGSERGQHHPQNREVE
ncbi:MAG: PrgI family protein [Candidatus Paceibacterota bacterium]